MQFTNFKNPLIFNSNIVEWDITSANVSIIRQYQMLPDAVTDKLQSFDKQTRVTAVGKICKENVEFSNAFNSKFDEVMSWFIETNDISQSDIVSVKKDAIFVNDVDISEPTLGFIEFKPKNSYHSAILTKRYEFYVSSDCIDVKGLSDDVLPKHEDGILSLIRVLSNRDSTEEKLRQLIRYATMYKNRMLSPEHYREFNSTSQFKSSLGKNTIFFDVWDDDIDELDITTNYVDVILPILSLFATG